MQTLIVIASLGEGSKVCYDASKNKYHVPNNMRGTIKVGDTAITQTVSFTSETVAAVDADGVPTGETKVQPCAEWSRQDITFAGGENDAILAFTAGKRLEAKAAKFVDSYAKSLEAYDFSKLVAA